MADPVAEGMQKAWLTWGAESPRTPADWLTIATHEAQKLVAAARAEGEQAERERCIEIVRLTPYGEQAGQTKARILAALRSVGGGVMADFVTSPSTPNGRPLSMIYGRDKDVIPTLFCYWIVIRNSTRCEVRAS